jgi:peptidyl-prolyl cis-trans isomerase D
LFMSIIQTIRDKGAAIIIGVIALSLIGFLLMDANQGGTRSLFGSNSTEIGSINGEDIELEEYTARIKSAEAQNPGMGAMRGQMMQQIWDQLISEKLVEEEFEKLGLVFTTKEFDKYLISDDSPPAVKQAFTDPATGQFDQTKARQWWQQVRKSNNPEQRQLIDEQVIQPMRLMSLYSKYTSLIGASYYMPKWLAQKEDTDQRSFATISYVAIPYNVIPDNAVKVTDDDITEYLNKNKKKYKQEAGRMISYVQFNAAPNAQDSARTLQSLMQLKQQFAADTNARAFLARNSSAINFADQYSRPSDITSSMKDSILKQPVGGVVGPYLDGSNYVIAKLVSTKILPDSIKCRHILIGTVDRSGQPLLADSIAKRRIDSVQAAIASGVDFNVLEPIYSTDEAAKQTKGEMTFDLASIQGDNFARPFADFLLNDKGETKKVVKTDFGWHYIEILNKFNPQPTYKVAYFAREIRPSDETVNTANAAATKLAAAARTEQELDAYIKKNGLTKLTTPTITKENDWSLNNIQEARPIIKWAFSADKGEVSPEPFTVGEQFIVAVVSKVVKEGVPDVATARPMVESIIRNRKRAEQIIKKLNNPTTLEAAAAVYTKPILVAGADSLLTFTAAMVNGIGQEPKVIGASFNKAYQTKVSPPIAGETGVFVIKVNGIGMKAADPASNTLDSRLVQQRQAAMYQSFESLKKMANIKDKRSKFY